MAVGGAGELAGTTELGDVTLSGFGGGTDGGGDGEVCGTAKGKRQGGKEPGTSDIGQLLAAFERLGRQLLARQGEED